MKLSKSEDFSINTECDGLFSSQYYFFQLKSLNGDERRPSNRVFTEKSEDFDNFISEFSDQIFVFKIFLRNFLK